MNAITDSIPNVPHPLRSRVKDDVLVVGFFVSDTGEVVDQLEPLAGIARVLVRLSPLPLRLFLFMPRAERYLRPVRDAFAPIDSDVCPVSADDCAGRLLQTEAVLLPQALAAGRQPLLASYCVPTVVQLADDEEWRGGGLAVRRAQLEDVAALLFLLCTDPPTRRRALDAQRLHLAHPGPKRWRVEGVFDSSYSLAIVNRRLAMALEASVPSADDVSLLTYEQGDDPEPSFAAVESPRRIRALWQRGLEPLPPYAALRNAWPPRVRDMRGERRILANYHWEETVYPARFSSDFNRVLDLITTGSRQTAKFLQDAGVAVPMAVVRNGVEHVLETAPEPLPCELPTAFRFLHISSCFPRKGADVLLAAYGKAFRRHHDVVLIIKTFANPHNDVAEQLSRLMARDREFPRVEVHQEDWTPGQIVSLYRACQVLVAPSRGEGFGLPLAEAMLHGVPVIATAWGGHLDFCSEETAWLIDCRLEPARTHLSVPESLWAEPDVDHLGELMRQLYAASADQLAPRLNAARETIRKGFTWEQVARRTRASLAAVDAQPGPLPTVKVGWVSTWGSRCGIAAYSAHLTAAFPAGELTIFAPGNEALEHEDEPSVRRIWELGTSDLTAVAQEAEHLGLSAVVIQYHWAFFDLLVLVSLCDALMRRGIRVVLDFHNTRGAPGDIERPSIRDSLAKCDRLLVHTLDDVQRFQGWGLVQNLTLFPLGVYPVPMPDEAAASELRRALRLESKTVLATYGYLMPHKGLRQLLRALPALIAIHADLHLLMVNAWYSERASGEELQHLTDLITALNLGDRVTFETRYLSEPDSMALLRLADLIVFPYQMTQESSSAAVRMAISAGRPIAVTPLDIFADVAPATIRLPGKAPAELATGLDDVLRKLKTAEYAADAVARVSDYAEYHDAHRRSAQLRGMITGIVRQLEVGE